jgi:ABC-type nickel/cobalt efflux system permease component RcnA
VKEPRAPSPSPPPPLEANDRLVAGSISVGWALALIVLLILRGSLPADARWWIWTCATGLAMGLFGLWYVPRFKRARARAAERRAAARLTQSAPRDSGSNTVSSTDTPGKSTMS